VADLVPGQTLETRKQTEPMASGRHTCWWAACADRSVTALVYAGTEPSANSSDPMANRTAIHQPRALGAHHVDPAAGFWCLWWRRDYKSAGMGGRNAVLGLNAIDQMFFLPSYPSWSLMIIAADIAALWGLCTRNLMTTPAADRCAAGRRRCRPWRSRRRPSSRSRRTAIGLRRPAGASGRSGRRCPAP
jgi:hypothetical protein